MRYPFVLREGLDRTAIQRELESRGIATLMVWTGNVLRQPGFAAIEHRAPAGAFPPVPPRPDQRRPRVRDRVPDRSARRLRGRSGPSPAGGRTAGWISIT